MESLEPTEIVRLTKQVTLPDSMYSQIMTFVDQRRKDASFYGGMRNGGSKEKIIDDIMVGVLAEYITFEGFRKAGFEFVAPPDLTYVPKGEKQWKPDLVVVEKNYVLKNLHVKGSRGYKDFITWTFQLGDVSGNRGTDPLLTLPETDQSNFVSLVHITGYNTGTIMVYGQWHTAKKFLDDPILPDKMGLKKCLYYSSEQGKLVDKKTAVEEASKAKKLLDTVTK